MNRRRSRSRQRLLHVAFSAFALTLAPLFLNTQEPQPSDNPDSADAATFPTPGPPVTVSGVVLSAATGKPLPRALVKANGNLGALTDDQGRFTIPGIPSEETQFQVEKPGFHTPGNGGLGFSPDFPEVQVAARMPELKFFLTPDNSITGQITLSTGVPAEGVHVVLLQKMNANGRAAWSEVATHQATPNGTFQFYGLNDGTYLVETQPELGNYRDTELTCTARTIREQEGFEPVFYGGTDKLSNATRIAASSGGETEIHLALERTTFHMVHIGIVNAPTEGNWKFTQTLLDGNGQGAPYPLHEDKKDHSLCVYLPDGSYTLEVVASAGEESSAPSGSTAQRADSSSDRVGVLSFKVEGRAKPELRLTMEQAASTPVFLHYQPGPPRPSPTTEVNAEHGGFERENDGEPLAELDASPRDWVSGENAQNADSVDATTYAFGPAPPGAYWIRAIANTGSCIGEVTSQGQNLAHSPWMVGPAGTGAPIEVVVRTDCASLTVAIPQGLAAEATSLGAKLHVYVIPESPWPDEAQFDIDPNNEFSHKLEDLAPGRYRVYVFRTRHLIEYMNPAAPEPGAGQEITLEADGNATLVAEEVEP